MWDEEIYLVSVENSGEDEYGNPSEEERWNQVYGDIKSIGQKEFYQGNASGFKPEIGFIIADYMDYNGEKSIIHGRQGIFTRYKIVRTYRKNDTLEVICEGGVNIGASAVSDKNKKRKY